MRTVGITVMAMVALGTVGCQVPGQGAIGSGSGADRVPEVQSLAAEICSFLPTTQTVLAIFGASQPGLQTAAQIAEAICAAVQSQPRTTPG